MTLWIFTQQKASLPSWAPFVGEDFVHLSADFTSAQAVTPGQGQAVVIAGVQVGKVSSVDLEEGHAVVGMDIEPKYLELIHPDATLLLRPKTNLNDMVVEVDPGKAPRPRRGRLPLPALAHRTERQLRSVPLHPRRRHAPLPAAAGRRRRPGDRRPRHAALRRLPPPAALLALRRRPQPRRRLAPAGARPGDPQLRPADRPSWAAATSSSNASSPPPRTRSATSPTSRGRSRNRWSSSRRPWPPSSPGFASSNRFSEAARPALLGLIPQAQALGPAFKAQERLFSQTAGADPRPDPSLHPADPAGADPPQAGLRRPR